MANSIPSFVHEEAFLRYFLNDINPVTTCVVIKGTYIKQLQIVCYLHVEIFNRTIVFYPSLVTKGSTIL